MKLIWREAIVEMYLAGVSVRWVEDIAEGLWGTRVSWDTVSKVDQKAFKNVSLLTAHRVDGEDCRRILSVCEGHKEDKTEGAWLVLLKDLKEHGLMGVRLVISKACLGRLVEALADVYPEADWQRCLVHFYRNVFSHVPNGKVREVAAMLKAI